MARKQLVPPGSKRGGRGKSLLVAAPPPPRGRKPKLGTMAGRAGAPPPLPSPPPRPRATRAIGPPVQNPLPRAAARGPIVPAAEERTESTPMGPAMAGGIGASPGRLAMARAMRRGRVAF